MRLVLETAGRRSGVALATPDPESEGGWRVLGQMLDPNQRQNRDLALITAQLLTEAKLTPHDVTQVVVGQGPGSFTGLRVGITSAKVWAYAHKIPLVPVPTFLSLAECVPHDLREIWIVSDGLQGLIYAERFQSNGEIWQSTEPLHLIAVEEWLARHPGPHHVGGPAAPLLASASEEVMPLSQPDTLAILAAQARVSLRLPELTGEALFGVEPLYLRPSSAEEQAIKRRQAASSDGR